MDRRFHLTVLVLLSCLCAACTEQRTDRLISGHTMGTTYHIKVVTDPDADLSEVHTRIEQRLESLNHSMSTYRSDSEISRFNASLAVDRPFPVSSDFYAVMQVAGKVHKLTGGAWDGTVNPLVNLWGFGAGGPVGRVPGRHTIEGLLDRVGFDHIDVSEAGVLKKRRPDISIDLASIAKGYGVDAIAELLRHAGYTDYLVEIGGEVYAAGRRPDGKPWRVGINQPEKSAPADKVYKALPLMDQAMATSGDYRNYVEIEGRLFSHIIDPRSGYPVRNGVVSASVIAPNCTLADGLATALVVMGAQEGLGLLDRLDRVEGLVVVRQPDGTFRNFASKGIHLK